MFYKAVLPTSLKHCTLAISWSHFPCLTSRALENMELAGGLCYYTKLHLQTSTANCSCPIARAKLLTQSVLPAWVINCAASSEPALLQEAEQPSSANALQPASPNSNTGKQQDARKGLLLWNSLLPDANCWHSKRLCNLPGFQIFFTEYSLFRLYFNL